MPRRALVLVSCLLVAGGVAGCGSTEVAGDVVPKTTPELTPPPIELGAAPAASGDDDTGATGASGSTGATGSASSSASPQSSGTPAPSGGGTATPVTPAPATPAAPAPAAPTPPTGGADDGTSTTPDANPGAKANPGGASPGSISDFCTQNPGACGQ